MMQRRLMAMALLLALFGADSAFASVCQACCLGPAMGQKVHRRPSDATTPLHGASRHMHSQAQSADCSECPKATRPCSIHQADCSNLGQVQALQPNSRVFSLQVQVSLAIARQTTASSMVAPTLNEAFSRNSSPPRSISFGPTLVSLRI